MVTGSDDEELRNLTQGAMFAFPETDKEFKNIFENDFQYGNYNEDDDE